MPEASAPEAAASSTPDVCTCALPARTTLSSSANGAARMKLLAVAARGSATPRPRSEYTPQATPASAIEAAPSSGGAPEALARAQAGAEHRQLHRAEEDQRAAAGGQREVGKGEEGDIGVEHRRREPVGLGLAGRCRAQPHQQRQCERTRDQADAGEARRIDQVLPQRQPAEQRIGSEGPHRQGRGGCGPAQRPVGVQLRHSPVSTPQTSPAARRPAAC